MPTLGRALARSLLVLILVCLLNCSTSPKRHSQPKLKEPPVSVKVESETAVALPETPSEFEPSSLTPETRFYLHRVRWQGETLSIIAKWYTGSLKNWKTLSNVNPTLDLNRIVIGDNILIPEDLLKTHKAMPFSFLSSSDPKKRVQTITSNKPPTASGTAELFGPIDHDQPSAESGAVELFGPIENDLSSINSDTIELFKTVE
ncbi:MAG: LysM domain-containing protein [Desulfobacterales bacterium]